MTDSDRDKVSSFLYHLGKGIWKSIPVLGPLVEELFYAQFEKQLRNKVDALSAEDLQAILGSMRLVDLPALDERLEGLSSDIQSTAVAQFARVLADLSTKHSETIADIKAVESRLDALPTILTLVQEVRQRMHDQEELGQLLTKHEVDRDRWIQRISPNQRRLLQNIPAEYTPLTTLWQTTLRLIPDCGYKEFRFRLHELEWLGLVERTPDPASRWRYRRRLS